MHRLEVRTQRRTELVDITAQVKAQVAGGGVRAGVCQVFVPHTTAAVTINEGIELGKIYGGESSGQFINGILDAVRRHDLEVEGQQNP